jgi:signal transduction histidine kinase
VIGAAVLLYALVAAATVAIVTSAREFALAGASPLVLVAELGAGALLLVAALAAQAWRPRTRFTAPLAAAALAWPLGEWNSPGAGAGFTVGLALAGSWVPLLAQGALSGPDEAPLRRTGAVAVAAGWLACVGLLALAPATVFDPAAQGCLDCPENLLLLSADGEAWHTLSQIGLAAAAGWVAAVVVLAALRTARAGRARARRAAPVLMPTAAALSLFAADALHGLDRGFQSNDPTDRALRAAQAASLALVAAGVVWERVRARRTRAAVARLVVELGSGGALRTRLAARLGDPSLSVLYAGPDGAGWVEGDGSAAQLPAGATLVVAAERPVAALVHRPGLLDDPALADVVAAGSRLALQHERLGALRAAQLAQLQASRARIVATADAERARLERDLHDGAQQRLVALALTIRVLGLSAGPELGAELSALEHEVTAAVAELRQIAHGLFPAVLAEEGLDAALDVLSEQNPRLVRRDVTAERLPPAVEAAAYFLVAAVLTQAAPADVAVAVRRDDDVVNVELETEADLGAALTALEDRAGALGGKLAVDGRRLRAELPCAS